MAETADLVVALVMAGMGLAFVVADPRGPTSRALGLGLALGGCATALNVPLHLGVMAENLRFWSRAFALFEAAAPIAICEWLLRVRATAGAGALGRRLLRAAQAFFALYALLGLVFPEVRVVDFLGVDPGSAEGSRWRPELLTRPGYYLFWIPFNAALLLALASIIELGRSRPDSAERGRLLALACAAPFLLSGMSVSPAMRPVATTIGVLIFLVGSIRYHVRQGQRGQFLAQFLSPQVEKLVQERGLAAAMEQRRAQISVVACDLRGFTAFSEAAQPEDVIALVREYHAAASTAVSEVGGTIKDFAGDGVLVLIGAPLACADHPTRALRLARRLRSDVGAVLVRWQRLGLGLGVGIGVASGYATVGVIGSGERLEYAAVGSAVNLAARLCARAEAGQILVDQRTVGLLGPGDDARGLERLEEAALKGFARPLAIYALAG